MIKLGSINLMFNVFDKVRKFIFIVTPFFCNFFAYDSQFLKIYKLTMRFLFKTLLKYDSFVFYQKFQLFKRF